MNKATLSSVLLLAAVCALGQSVTVRDLTQNNPLIVNTSANLISKGDNQFCVFDVTNQGPGIVAYVIEMQMAASQNIHKHKLTIPHDHFAAGTVPALTGHFMLNVPCNMGQPTTMELTFAQFADGSIWSGSTPTGQKMLMDQRRDVQNYLTELRLANSYGTLSQLINQRNVDALPLRARERFEVGALSNQIQQVQAKNQGNPGAISAFINQMYATVQSRASWVK